VAIDTILILTGDDTPHSWVSKVSTRVLILSRVAPTRSWVVPTPYLKSMSIFLTGKGDFLCERIGLETKLKAQHRRISGRDALP
jgi:hypothetical protein